MEAYVYTRVTKTGEVIEHHGDVHLGKDRAHFSNRHNRHHWMTGLSNNEGEVRGHSVWFTKPNKRGAIEVLNRKDKERVERLLAKSARTLERVDL